VHLLFTFLLLFSFALSYGGKIEFQLAQTDDIDILGTTFY